ncbi:MAG: mechanosensitive ion channel family protein [Vicinamibacterales bacterium]
MFNFSDQFLQILSIDRIALITFSLVRASVILLAAVIATRVTDRSVRALRERLVSVMMRRTPGTAALELEKRGATIGGILRRTIKTVIWIVAGVMVLKEFNFDIAPILAGAGIVGLAVGFGAQNLVRDVITGVFMLLENQISENDVAVINGTGGQVVEINLRTTVLRGLDGTMHVFPNGVITSLSNMTRDYSYYVFNVGVAYKEDTDRVVAVLREVAQDLQQTAQFGPSILEPLDVLGVDQFADSAVIIKARLKTLPIKQWEVGREMNRRIKKRFDEERIEIPYPHRSLYFGEASLPFRMQMDGSTRDELKAVVREVLAEGR